MKNLFTLLFAFACFSMNAQLFTQDFENGLEPMTIVDVDGQTPAPNVADFADAWTVANPTSGNETNIAVSNSWYNPAGQADDWMMTPAIEGITGGTIVRWDAKAQDPSFPDGYSVYVSTVGNTVDDFLAGDEIFSVAAEVTEWTQQSAGLAAYEGQTIYIAWRNNSTDQFLLYIDNIEVVDIQPFDLAVGDFTTERYHEVGNTVQVTGTLTNEGSSEVNSFDVEWTVGGTTYNESFTGLAIAPFTEYNFTLSDAISVDEAISYDYSVTVSNPNGEMDGNDDNNTGGAAVAGLSFIPQKNVVIEEATGTWCQFCPRGAVGMDYMEDNYPETFIGIAVHNGDPMAVTEYDSGFAQFIGGYPSGAVDRAISDVDPAAANLEAIHNQVVTQLTPVQVSQSITYDEATREITIVAEANFATQLAQEMRLNVIITEDGVTGTGSGYAQVNAYANNALGPLPPYDMLPNPVPAAQMVYEHVGRALLGGFDGTASSIPAEVFAGETHSFTYTYTVPATFDENNVNIVAVVIESSTGAIMNGTKSHLSDFISGTNNVYRNDLAKVYPNPFADEAFVELNMETSSEVSLQLTNAVGQVIQAKNYGVLSGQNLLSIQAEDLANGVYFVHITMGDVLITKRVLLSK